MFNVCPACGQYAVEKNILPGEGWWASAVCPDCGHAHPFLRLPLFVVTGASGAGKTALALAAAGIPGFVNLEMDILWRPAFDQPQDDYRAFRSAWLRLAKNIDQAGRPVVLYGSGVPSQFETNPERRYFSQAHYLALVCQPDVLTARLQGRPSWRAAGSAEFVDSMQRFNRWFIEQAGQTQPPLDLLDTSRQSLAETVASLRAWLWDRWNPEQT